MVMGKVILHSPSSASGTSPVTAQLIRLRLICSQNDLSRFFEDLRGGLYKLFVMVKCVSSPLCFHLTFLQLIKLKLPKPGLSPTVIINQVLEQDFISQGAQETLVLSVLISPGVQLYHKHICTHMFFSGLRGIAGRSIPISVGFV